MYLLNIHAQRISILRQHVFSYWEVALLTAYRWKRRHRSLRLDPHCICRGESAHSSLCLILFKRFLHLTFSSSITKSMYKARFIIASRSLSCAYIQDNTHPVETPPLTCLFSRSYIVHSTFAIIFPLHLIYLVLTTSASLESLLAGLSFAIKIHFAPVDKSRLAILQSTFPYGRFFRLTALLTVGLTLPSVLWFISVSMSP